MHSLAYGMYKIKAQFDKAFFHAFSPDATSDNGQKECLNSFYKWLRYCDAQNELNENKDRYARKQLQVRHSRDRNFKLFYDIDPGKYHRQLIFGHKLLLGLLGSQDSIGKLDQGDHVHIISNNEFKERMKAYLEQLTLNQYNTIVDAFNFQGIRHKAPEDVWKSQKGVSHFAKKILSDAFGIVFEKDGKKKRIDASIWKRMKEYEPGMREQNEFQDDEELPLHDILENSED